MKRVAARREGDSGYRGGEVVLPGGAPIDARGPSCSRRGCRSTSSSQHHHVHCTPSPSIGSFCLYIHADENLESKGGVRYALMDSSAACSKAKNLRTWQYGFILHVGNQRRGPLTILTLSLLMFSIPSMAVANVPSEAQLLENSRNVDAAR